MTARARLRLIALATLGVVLGLVVIVAGLRRTEPGTPAAETRAYDAVDIGFCQDMAAHHAQAILMSEMAIERASPRVRALAIAILASQAQESGAMRGWLSLWGAPQLSSAPMAWMSTRHGGTMRMTGGGGRMPGMASQADLKKLGLARGPAADALFLALMYRHHAAGIVMAEDAQAHARNDLVRGLAAEMVVEQTNENAIIAELLASNRSEPRSKNGGG